LIGSGGDGAVRMADRRSLRVEKTLRQVEATCVERK
jgi:hypothetical protein